MLPQKNEPPAARKRKRKRRKQAGASSAASSCDAGMCEDVVRSIFARLPARTVVASMALSKHHRRLLCCPNFRSLHCRLGPPLPRPHIAYVATAKLRRRSGQTPIIGFHGFHVAGAGHSSSAAPMRSLAGATYLNKRYVNTCNGVLLLAGEPKQPSTCVLWNPAVAEEEKEVAVPVSVGDDCVVLGLGYGRRSQTYKLLVSQRVRRRRRLASAPPIIWFRKQLLVYELGGGASKLPVLRNVSSPIVDGEFSKNSLYIDGTIYLLHICSSTILAFDVDNEAVTTIDLPGEHEAFNPMEMYDDFYSSGDAVEKVTSVNNLSQPMSNLMELCGRPCVETHDGESNLKSLWLLTEDHRWERRCVITNTFFEPELIISRCLVAGVWDCGGMLVVYLHHPSGGRHSLCLRMKNASTEKKFDGRLPFDMTPEWPDYAFCWGYKPTLVSPASIVGKLSEDEERRLECTANVMEALKPINEHDKRKGHKATLTTVCFMEFLVRIMKRLPDNMEDVARMPVIRLQ